MMETSELNSFEALKNHCIASYEQLKVQMTRPRQEGDSSQFHHYMAVAHSHASRKSLRAIPLPSPVFNLAQNPKLHEHGSSRTGLLGFAAAKWDWKTGNLEITAFSSRSINSASSLAGDLLQFLVLKVKEEFHTFEHINFVGAASPKLEKVRIKVDQTQKRFVTNLGHLGFYMDTSNFDRGSRFTLLTVQVTSLITILEERMAPKDLDFLRQNGLDAYLQWKRKK
jgi:hypothetical protein